MSNKEVTSLAARASYLDGAAPGMIPAGPVSEALAEIRNHHIAQVLP
jgi:hypothetical protein